MIRNEQKEKLKQSVRQSLLNYRHAYLEKDYSTMATTKILNYAKKGLLKTEDGNVCLWERSPEAYPILRLAKEGKLVLNESCIHVL